MTGKAYKHYWHEQEENHDFYGENPQNLRHTRFKLRLNKISTLTWRIRGLNEYGSPTGPIIGFTCPVKELKIFGS